MSSNHFYLSVLLLDSCFPWFHQLHFFMISCVFSLVTTYVTVPYQWIFLNVFLPFCLLLLSTSWRSRVLDLLGFRIFLALVPRFLFLVLRCNFKIYESHVYVRLSFHIFEAITFEVLAVTECSQKRKLYIFPYQANRVRRVPHAGTTDCNIFASLHTTVE